jgi:hypothetical protein
MFICSDVWVHLNQLVLIFILIKKCDGLKGRRLSGWHQQPFSGLPHFHFVSDQCTFRFSFATVWLKIQKFISLANTPWNLHGGKLIITSLCFKMNPLRAWLVTFQGSVLDSESCFCNLTGGWTLIKHKTNSAGQFLPFFVVHVWHIEKSSPTSVSDWNVVTGIMQCTS